MLRRIGRIRVLATVEVTNAAGERRTAEAAFDLRPAAQLVAAAPATGRTMTS